MCQCSVHLAYLKGIYLLKEIHPFYYIEGKVTECWLVKIEGIFFLSGKGCVPACLLETSLKEVCPQ